MVDHINGDILDNRAENLRACTNAQNQYNGKRKSNNRSGRKGVVEHKKSTKKKYQAKIVVHGRTISLGYYETVEQAGDAYERGAKLYAKEFARKD